MRGVTVEDLHQPSNLGWCGWVPLISLTGQLALALPLWLVTAFVVGGYSRKRVSKVNLSLMSDFSAVAHNRIN